VVRRGLETALRRLVEWGVEDAALAPLGTGAGNLDAEDAARVMIPVLRAHLERERYPRRVEIVVDSDYEHEVFEAELNRPDVAAPSSRPDAMIGPASDPASH
jgi:O-acetyl-ADP-ribose deacetylase (regulator of RNase III)